jgi:hypothetical protein
MKKEEEQSYRKAHKAETEAYNRKYREAHPEEAKACHKKWQEEHPEEVQKAQHDSNRKGGKYYDHKLEYMQTGIPGERHRIRMNHAKQYRPYKAIIAPDRQIHHEWVPQTSDYRGVALVEADQHMHGFVDVIEILDGKITLRTEEEVKNEK